MIGAILVAATIILTPQGERVPDSAVVNGVPQGMFVGRSLITGKAVCLLFLGGGRITRAIPEGGLESFGWNKHRTAHGPDSGTWQMRGSQLVVTWGDGGVHQGPITVNPDGIEFYGKRYSKPAVVSVPAIAGRWESARGTAITGGPGINRVSELVIAADGHYQWLTTIGGVVQGRVASNDRSLSGTVAVRGLTITFTSDAGTTTSHTLLPAAGQPVSAFSVDADMFTRAGPASATVPQAPSANVYQGLAFTLPAGWTTGIQQNRFVAAPANQAADGVVFVIIYGADALAGSFEDWLRAKMAADLGSTLRVLQAAPPTRGKLGALDTLSAGRTVQDQRDGSARALLQIYYGVSDGRQAGLAMAATTSEAALKAQMPLIQALFQSLRFGASEAGAKPMAPSPAPASRSSLSTTVAAADLVGQWSHGDSAHTQYRTASGGNAGSTTVAYGDGYTFRADGTFTYSFTGMYNSVYLKESDSGTWGFEDGFLVIRGRTRGVKTYRIIQLQPAADGSSALTLLDRSYQPTDSNINVWGEKYLRKGK